MSDLIRPDGYPERSATFETRHTTLDDFQTLTMNRNKNKGSLVATSTGGLKCVDHHVFKPLNGFGSVKPEAAQEVREIFVNVAKSELTRRFNLLLKSEKVRNPGNVKALEQKIADLNQLISDKFLKSTRAFQPLKRKDVEKFIKNIDLLKLNATAERLLNMTPGELLNLTKTENAEKAERYGNQTAGELKQIIEEGKPQQAKAPSNGTNLMEAKKTKDRLSLKDLTIRDALRNRNDVAEKSFGFAKAAQETILKKLCPDISSSSPSLAAAVKKYNGIFAQNKMKLYFTDAGYLATTNPEDLARDFEKLLDALIQPDNKLRKDLNCEVTDEEALKTLDEFEKKLPQDDAAGQNYDFDQSMDDEAYEILMNPLKHFIPSEPLNPKKEQ